MTGFAPVCSPEENGTEGRIGSRGLRFPCKGVRQEQTEFSKKGCLYNNERIDFFAAVR